MGKIYRKLTVSPDTFKRVTEDCVAEYRRVHPEFNEIPISQNKIIYEMSVEFLKT